MIGAYQSGITLTASAIAERYGIPFLTPESVAANLTERGFKWFFRVTPVAADFARAYSAFLKAQKAAGQKVGSVALVHENTEYGNSVASVIADVFGKDGLPVTLKISYSANSTDVQPQVLQLKEKNPDVAIFISYTSDAILYSQDHEGAELEAGDHDRRRRGLQRSVVRQDAWRRASRGWSAARPSPPASRAACRRSSTSSTRRRPAATDSTTSRRAGSRASW